MQDLVGCALVCGKDATIKVSVFGTAEGIIQKIDYKVFSELDIVSNVLNTISLSSVGLLASEVLEEITEPNILGNFEFAEGEEQIASLIEEVIKKAIINYFQIQMTIPNEPYAPDEYE